MEDNISNWTAFPKLNAFNYPTWKVDMRVLLLDRGCWEFISGDTTAPAVDATTSEKQSYQRRKDRAFTTIYQGVDRQFQSLLSETTNGKTAWDILLKNFEPKSRARLAGLIDEFYELKFQPNEETIGIFCRRVHEKRQSIADAGFEIPDFLLCFQLIRKLPADYDNLVQILYRLEDKEFKADFIESQLINESGRIRQKIKDEGLDLTGNAYNTRAKEIVFSKRNTTNRVNNMSYPYRSSGAFLDPKDRGNTPKTCKFCGKKNHTENNCFAKKREEQEKFQVRQCSKNQPNSKYRSTYYSEYSELTTKVEANLASTNDSNELGEWLIDSAATSHFCKDREWFTNFRPLPPTEALIGDKDCKLTVLGVGDIIFHVKDENNFVESTLKNVLYAPNLRRNLLGGVNMDIAGFKIIWENSKMKIFRSDGTYFFTVHRVDKLYIMYGLPDNRIGEMYNVHNVNYLDLFLIHRRFCHVNVNLIKQMSRQDIVRGIEHIEGNVNSCTTCNIAKSSRESLKINYGISTKNVLDRVYMDLWGPSPIKSTGGNVYFLSIIDDYSRFIYVYTIKKKSDVFMCFKKYLAEVERQLNIKLKCVRTDNGLEFCNYEFEKFLTNLGIRMERTSIYTPEQCGVAERFNRTALDGIRAMLQDSGLHPRFWAEALHAFVHTRNRCEHKLTRGRTPLEIWAGKKPSVRHFRIFGSLAYVHVPKVKRNKLQPRAKLGIMVGYAKRTKGYRIWLPKERNVVETIHVKIDEKQNGVMSLYGKKSEECVIFNNSFEEDSPYELNHGINKLKEEEKKLITREPKSKVGTLKSENENSENNGEPLIRAESEIKTLKPIEINAWKRIEKPRSKSSRIDVFYYPPNSNVRLRSKNDVRKYCEKEGVEYTPDQFSFKPENTKAVTDTCSKSDKSSSESSDEINDLYFEDVFQNEVYNIEIPKNFNESQNVTEKEDWNIAMQEELKVMKERNVWNLVDTPPNAKVIGSRWVYSVKTDDKNGKRFKARLVAQGFKQKYGIDYTDIFSPVVNFSVIKFLFIALVSVLSWQHAQLDVKSAYLYGNLKEQIFMQQPPGFVVKGQENQICLLKKAIYGLHQSGREWNTELDFKLRNIGFEKLNWVNCVYKFQNDAILVIYVDDIVIFGKTDNIIKNIISLLKGDFELKELGKIKYLLGVNFKTYKNSTYLHQHTYIGKLMERFSGIPKSFVSLPIKVGSDLPPKCTEKEIIETELMKKYPYRTLIGCLSFLANRSRPDIAFAVNVMSQFCNGYTMCHWKIVVDIFNYVCNTRNYQIDLSNVNNSFLVGYSDANWGCNLTNRYSTSGYIIYFCNVPFVWKSCKQKCIALSSMESEFVSLTESVKELLWFSKIINELGVFSEVMEPVQFCDNQSAIYFSKNSIENVKTKHIDIKFQFIRKLINEEEFVLKYVKSKLNLADFLTKPLTKDKLHQIINKLYVYSSKACQ